MSNSSNQYVVDTNVPIVANYATNNQGISIGIGTECSQACVNAISDFIRNKSVLVIDAEHEILNEYRKNLKKKNGLARKFLKWVYQYRLSRCYVNEVSIKKANEGYVDFPNDKSLKNFDREDRKFIAVAIKHPSKPPILQATDSQWWGFRNALSRHGVRVQFLCEDYVRKKYLRKAKGGGL